MVARVGANRWRAPRPLPAAAVVLACLAAVSPLAAGTSPPSVRSPVLLAGAPGGPAEPEGPHALAASAWTNLTSTLHPAPPSLGGAVLATDPSEAGVVLFGGTGTGGSSSTSNATWVYNVSGWTNLTPVAPGPSARSGAQMVWDPSKGGILLYGGISPSGSQFYNDTWLFRNGSWTNLSASLPTNPGPRGAGELAVDPGSGAALLAGGTSASGTFSSATWEFVNGSWSDVTGSAGTPPAPRVFEGLAPDPALGGVVLFGGQAMNTSSFRDTWLFHHGSWSKLANGTSGGPGPRRLGYFAYDSTYGADLLYGGDTGIGVPVSTTWALNTSGNWSNVTSWVGAPPSPRWAGAMADDPTAGGLVVYGGCYHIGCSSAANDTWTLAPPPITAQFAAAARNISVGGVDTFYANASGGLGGLSYTFNFGDGTSAGPSSVSTATHAYRASGAFGVSISVTDAGGAPAVLGSIPLAVVPTAVRPGSWTPLASLAAPRPAGDSGSAFDPLLGEVVLFGGTFPSGTFSGETWVRNATGWANRTGALPVAPSARGTPQMWYDPYEGGVVLFGGQSATSGFLSDTWLFNGTWTNRTAGVGPAPSARFQPATAYDSTDQEALLFGGFGPVSSPLNDTWAFRSGGWTNITRTAGIAPSGRDWASLANDPSDGGAVLFGGRPCGSMTCGDTWAFRSGSWMNLSGGLSAPAPRRGAEFAYDSVYGAAFLFGGDRTGTLSPGPVNDTWTFVDGRWGNVTAEVGAAPPSRWAAPLVDDPNLGGVVLFGGCVAVNCAGALGDTWELGPTPPTVSVRVALSATTAPSNATLTATAGGGLGALTFDWAFGDGIYQNGTSSPNALHTYSVAGTYQGRLTVVDAGGVRSSSPWSVTLGTPPVTPPVNKTCPNGTPRANGSSCPLGTTPIRLGPPRSALPWWILLLVIGAAGAAIVGWAVYRWKARGPDPPSSRAGGEEHAPQDRPPGPDATLPPSLPPRAGTPADGLGRPEGAGVPAPAAVGPPPTADDLDPEIGDPAGGPPLGDRILIHLHRQGRLGPDELVPASLTQAGLSVALGRPQSAFARTLQRLESTGLVVTELRHVRGAARRLKAYRLTNLGEARALELRARAPSAPNSGQAIE